VPTMLGVFNGLLVVVAFVTVLIRILRRNRWQTYGAGGSHRGNDMLVDHLADSIFQQHKTLSKRFNLS